MLSEKIIHVISYPVGIGAGNTGCQDGPRIIQQSKTHSLPLNFKAYYPAHSESRQLEAMPVIASICHNIAKDIQTFVTQNKIFLTLGGDQSCSAGTWSGAANAIRSKNGELGLIWIDAHMDAHTPETTPSGNIHGMPLAALLGFGDNRLTKILTSTPKLKAENICLIGIRSYEPEEADLLHKLNVKIYDAETIYQRGLQPIMTEAFKHITQHTTHFGITVDVDGIDPKDAPGVGTPVDKGIAAKDMAIVLQKMNNF